MVGKVSIDDMIVCKSAYISESVWGSPCRHCFATLVVVTEREATCLSAVLAITIKTGRAVTTGLIQSVSMVIFTCLFTYAT